MGIRLGYGSFYLLCSKFPGTRHWFKINEINSEITSLEEKVPNMGFINKTEAEIVKKLVEKFGIMKIKKDCIGVIAPYRAQIEYLTKSLSKYEGVEINTVDKFQGRENKIIILSFVRSGSKSESEIHSELLESINRLTVAVTRAQYKLIAIGCSRSLKTIPVTKKLIDYFKANKMTFTMSKGELKNVLP